MFKKLLHKTETGASQSAVKAAKLELTRRLLVTGFVLALACAAGMAYYSQAWFANNKDVDANNASVTSTASSANLFIRPQTDGENKHYYTTLSTDWSAGTPLYPISTADCENWFYIAQRTENSVTTGNVTAVNYYASQYAAATVDNNTGLYNEPSGVQRRAYYCSKYNLYTDKAESLNVYLHPTDPISITGDAGLTAAIRVALVTDRLVFVYAPVAESGTGMNFIDDAGTKAVADTFYAVTGTQTAEVQNNILVDEAGLANYKGVAVDGDPYNFNAGTTPICTATAAGTNVDVYVWLEGMDAQGVSYIAGSGSIAVNLNFVGVPVV
ncbi:MAG: hypothetical protein ACI4O3_00130 [Oscillospiraceae bacterium]